MTQAASAADTASVSGSAPAAVEPKEQVVGTEAPDNENRGKFVLPVTAANAKVEAPARMQLTLGAELADDDHHLVHEQQHRQRRYTSSDIEVSAAIPKISLAVGTPAGSERSARSTRDEESSWTLLSHIAAPDMESKPVPLREVPVGTLAGDAVALMKGVFAAGSGSVFLTEEAGAQAADEPNYGAYRKTTDAEVYQPGGAKQSLKQALHGC